jgi:hypothetical protein
MLVGAVSGCGGGHKPAGISPFPARITLNPAGPLSVQLGNTLNFTASATNGTGTSVTTSITFASSDTSILNIAPNGVACAGLWDALFSTCTPGGTGVVQVTASGLGSSSVPVFVFVHPPIDNITVSGVLLDNVPVQEPCLSQGQSMTVEAHAFSRGSDITSSVGPFTWSSNNPTVVSLLPIININYNVGTNQAKAIATFPGITEIYASASGVSSATFQQPQYSNGQGTSPILDFFETCPIQNIVLEVGHAGSQQTSFATTKGTSEAVVATLTDVMGNSSLPNTVGGVVLNKIPLTWSASQPGVISVGNGCLQSCTVSTPAPGAGSATASCSPPTCNIGFPKAPAVLSSSACAQFFQVNSCRQFIPVPVYASPLPGHTTAAISGLVQGASSTPAVLATSTGCADTSPNDCNTSIYSVSVARGAPGTPNFMPVSPNSLLYSPGGQRAFMGSDFGAQILNPTNFGTTNSAFTPLGTVTGKILASSADGSSALFSDTNHIPNQVYVVNAANASSTPVALNISGASAAAFSPDGLKAFIFGYDSNSNPNLFVYSTLQAMQTIPLPAQTTVSSIAFSTNAAFAYVVEPSNSGTGGPAVTVYNSCDNQISTNGTPTFTPQVIPLTASPIVFRALPDGQHFIVLESGGSLDYLTASITGIPTATLNQPASTSLCPMTVNHTLKNLNLQQGNIAANNFFTSADGTLLYVLASDRGSVLVYNVSSNSVSGIPLSGNATPLSGGMSSDAGTIIVVGNDGRLHVVTTSVGGSDQLQVSFPNLPDFLDPFCNFNPASGPCTFDTVLVKP